jgi:primosomal protein N' (replication factor Y)
VLLQLPNRIDGRSMPEVRAVDMRAEAQRAKGPRILSQRLVDAIEQRLERGEQTILFLNRRGYATSFLCPKCGHVATCPDCSIPFTVHRREGRLLCHLCGMARELPEACLNPQCRDPAVRMAGVGTERLEATVGALFPKARVERMDSDTTTRRGSHRKILSAFRSGRIDILVGTQMIAKGLDFPNVTLVGIVFADQALHHPDFRSGERTFQLVTQVAGRAGRGEIGGEVIVQTYTPGHAAIRHALAQDFLGFYEEEIEFRQALEYPPVGHMILVGIRDPNEQRALLVGREIARRLEEKLPGGTRISGPAPAPIARVQKLYRFQVIARGRAVRPMIQSCTTVAEETPLPRESQVWVDIDPVFLM